MSACVELARRENGKLRPLETLISQRGSDIPIELNEVQRIWRRRFFYSQTYFDAAIFGSTSPPAQRYVFPWKDSQFQVQTRDSGLLCLKIHGPRLQQPAYK